MIDNLIPSDTIAETPKKSSFLAKTEKIRDDLYVRKGIFGGYSMVYPFKNDDGTWNKRNTILFLVKFFGIIGLALLLLFMYKHDIDAVKAFYTNGTAAFNVSAFNPQYNHINLGNLNLVNLSNGT